MGLSNRERLTFDLRAIQLRSANGSVSICELFSSVLDGGDFAIAQLTAADIRAPYPDYRLDRAESASRTSDRPVRISPTGSASSR